MFPKHAAFDSETLNLLYRAYTEAGLELHGHPKGTTWKCSDSDRITLASRILSLAATGERDVLKLKRGAMNGFSNLGR